MNHNEAIKSSKVKCRQCGYKKNCKGTNSCKAPGRICRICGKLGHFPASLNCKIKRKRKQEKKSSRTLSTCQTLREFLRSKKISLKFWKPPYERLRNKHSMNLNMSKISNNQENFLEICRNDDYLMKKIQQTIKSINHKAQFETKFRNSSRVTRFFFWCLCSAKLVLSDPKEDSI